MKFIYSLLIYSLGLYSLIAIYNQNQFQLTFLDQSSLTIEGKSNINKFSCSYNSEYLSKKLTFSCKKENNKLLFKNATLTIINAGFDCGGNAINKDFHKLLKSVEYPHIKMSLKCVVLPENKTDAAYATVSYTITDKTIEYEFPVIFEKENNDFRLYGFIELNIEDFNLTPPKKVFGIIKVDKMIKINFDFKTTIKDI